MFLFVLFLLAGGFESRVPFPEVQSWFGANYAPRCEYNEDGGFLVSAGTAFSPFEIRPRWGKGKRQTLRGGKELYVVPVETERLVSVGYRFKGKPLDSLRWAYHPVEHFLVIEHTRYDTSAYLLQLVHVSGMDDYTGLILESDLNTGECMRISYYEQGSQCGVYDFEIGEKKNAPLRSVLVGSDYGGRVWPLVPDYDSNFQMSNLPRSLPYRQMEHTYESRKAYEKAEMGDIKDIRYRFLEERNPTFNQKD